MKADIHPENYRFVVFQDVSADYRFLTRSCAATDKTIEFEGTEYPLINLDLSDKSHPFYTGTQKLMDTEGRVDRFYRKYGLTNPEAENDGEGEGDAAES